MKKLLIIMVMVTCRVFVLNAQGDLIEEQRVFFRNEKSFAILLNSDGLGINFRDARRIDYLNKRFFEIELGTLKHPREYKQSNYYSQGSFVFGKVNSAVFLRGDIGRQHELFRKADLGGIAVRYFYAAGPTIAFYKPIFYRVLYPVSNNYEYVVREEKFDIQIHDPSLIYGKASFVKGMDETKVLPGLFVKGGFNFEYSKEDKVIHAIEIGATLSGYPKQIPIMASEDNRAVWFSLFASYRFGIVVDPLDPESNKLSNIFRRRRSAVVY
ncbi:MAG: hypothetical protein K0B05_13290 [Bacteroidales bacterium]|nr:hypothetical protein [Bacteroidales bacterium]